uniref:Uncharacterized protein n=1 Tax=Octactis speculum TaxID=3111310 RepID=A0A7S2MS60_9STRA|mmetsp:Transcript_9133/g.11695  ORF Transcript_9133/g.11695 Transcript_9133/m.11695 type:complete len:566 (+) Transcript_9133:116-1813(+)
MEINQVLETQAVEDDQSQVSTTVGDSFDSSGMAQMAHMAYNAPSASQELEQPQPSLSGNGTESTLIQQREQVPETTEPNQTQLEQQLLEQQHQQALVMQSLAASGAFASLASTASNSTATTQQIQAQMAAVIAAAQGQNNSQNRSMQTLQNADMIMQLLQQQHGRALPAGANIPHLIPGGFGVQNYAAAQGQAKGFYGDAAALNANIQASGAMAVQHMVPYAVNMLQEQPAQRKRKSKGMDSRASNKSAANGSEGDKRRRMQCWNCSPDCPNRGAGPERHHVAGMCGRCHQRWQKHPTSRWAVVRCVSKCRCDRCERSRAGSESRRQEAKAPPTEPTLAADLTRFRTLLNELKTVDEVSMTTLQRVCARTMQMWMKGPLENIDDEDTLSLVALSGYVARARSISAEPQPNETPDQDWLAFVRVARASATFGKVTSASPEAVALLGYDPEGINAHRLVSFESLPFFQSALMQLSLTEQPQVLSNVLYLSADEAVQIQGQMKVQSSVTGELLVFIKASAPQVDAVDPAAVAPPTSQLVTAAAAPPPPTENVLRSDGIMVGMTNTGMA